MSTRSTSTRKKKKKDIRTKSGDAQTRDCNVGASTVEKLIVPEGVQKNGQPHIRDPLHKKDLPQGTVDQQTVPQLHTKQTVQEDAVEEEGYHDGDTSICGVCEYNSFVCRQCREEEVGLPSMVKSFCHNCRPQHGPLVK